MAWVFSREPKKEFISGLFWQPLSGASGNELPSFLQGAGKETQRFAADMNFDLAIWRTHGVLQVGLATTDEGAAEGQYSIAAAIAEQIESESDAKSFLVAVEAPGGKWLYIAQREGVILPDGDQNGLEDQVRTAMLNSRALGSQWDVIIAPTHWGLPDSKERTLDDLLPQRGTRPHYSRAWKLRPVKAQHRKLVLLGIVALCALSVAFFGNRLYQGHAEKERIADAARRALMLKQQASASVPVIPPWHTAPLADALFAACLDGIDRLGNLWIGNWTPMSAECRNDQVSVMWQRGQYGWVDHLRAARPEIFISNDGNVASHSVPLEKLAPPTTPEAIPESRTRMLEIHSRAQRFNVSVDMTEKNVAVRNAKNETTPPPQWRTFDARVTSALLPPSALLEILNGPGFRLEVLTLRFEGRNRSWTMEGKQYVQL